MVIALLDACVLYPAALRDTLLRLATRDLQEHRGLTEEQARRLMSAMTNYFTEAAVTGYEELIVGRTCHEKDRHVLAAAIHARAAVIVTFNLKDFPAGSLRPYGIEARHPDTFLANLFQLTPSAIVETLREQASALKKPATPFESVLDILGQHAPVFASQVRDYLLENARSSG